MKKKKKYDNPHTAMYLVTKDGAKKLTDCHFEPDFIKKEDGTIELTGFSIVPNI